MYYSVSELAMKITPYQMELLLLMDKGFDLLSTEGANYRCWMEMENEDVGFTVRKDSANSLLELGLMKSVEEDRSGHFRYGISDKGVTVMERIDVRKPSRMRSVERTILKKGIEGVTYSHIRK